MKSLVYGVGLNDADYPVYMTVNGKQSVCPFYRKWIGMLTRCYYPKYKAKYHTYIGCSVCEEWLVFSNFKRWMEAQDWQGKHLDKDLLVRGNKIYSPENCVLVDANINLFTTDRRNDRGQWPIGVSFKKSINKFQASCSNPFTEKADYLGVFTTAEQAHAAWLKRKSELAQKLAKSQSDPRVSAALIVRYSKTNGGF